MTLSVDDEVVHEARRRAEAAGTSVNQLVREFLLDYTGKNRMNEIADLFDELSRNPKGNSSGWKFNREEAHERT